MRKSELNRLVIFGTAPASGRGGISSSIENCLRVLKNAGIPCKMMASHVPNESMPKAVARFLWILCWIVIKARRKDVFMLHVGPKGSLVRKVIIAALGRLRGVRVVTQYHSPIFLNYLRSRSGWFALAMLARLTDGNAALNRYWQRIYKKTLRQPFHVLSNPLPATGPLSRERKQGPDGLLKVACVARLVKEKNVAELIHCCEMDRSIRCKIVGDGVYRAELVRLAEACRVSEQIQFKGWGSSAQIMETLAESDIFILPSKYDSFGMVFVEALLAGLPVIAPNLLAVRCTLGGLVGVSFASNAREIVSAIRNLPQEHPSKIRESVLKRYGDECYLSNLSSLVVRL